MAADTDSGCFFPVPGITPPCFNLFALFDAQAQVWLPPNHILEVSRDTNLTLHFRMRWVKACGKACPRVFGLFSPLNPVFLELNRCSALAVPFPSCRFYFRNWHGTNPQEPVVYRCRPPGAEASSEQAEQGIQLLDPASFEYLFEQVGAGPGRGVISGGLRGS